MAESIQSHSTAACKSLGGIKRSHGGKFPMRHEPIAAFLDQLRDGVLEQDRSQLKTLLPVARL